MERKSERKSLENWIPKTEIGRRVLNGEFNNIDQVLALGKPILEPEIVDYFLPDLSKEKLEVRTTQRVTDSGKKNQFRVLMLVGDRNGHIGIGVGKNAKMTLAVESALRDAKLNIMKVPFGSGAWEDRGKARNTLPIKVTGKKGSVEVTLIPAPRGIGLACHPYVRKILSFAGVKDVWSFS
ncbi:MAG: 30S ribosomal protein S5, partial [Candidatus Micrarchaeota archaeon]|nr:30S ribosomal protein S5 [Candidatus Micrarchaeota archaeon]